MHRSLLHWRSSSEEVLLLLDRGLASISDLQSILRHRLLRLFFLALSSGKLGSESRLTMQPLYRISRTGGIPPHFANQIHCDFLSGRGSHTSYIPAQPCIPVVVDGQRSEENSQSAHHLKCKVGFEAQEGL
jgi:hypothetical protein